MRVNSLFYLVGPAFIVFNVVLFSTKLFLRSNGYPVSWFTKHGTDFQNLSALASNSGERKQQTIAARLLLALRLSVAILVTLAISLILVALMAR